MGTVINLRIGKLDVAWSKNGFLLNHSSIFREKDLGYENIHANKEERGCRVYRRQLRDMVGRLSLLGYSPANSKRIFVNLKKEAERHYGDLSINYDVLSDVLSLVDVNKVHSEGYDEYGLGEYVKNCILEDPEFKKKHNLGAELYNEDFEFLENFDAKWILTELSRNPKNLSEDVVWAYGYIVESGYFVLSSSNCNLHKLRCVDSSCPLG